MTEPRRLLDGGGTQLESLLLEAGRNEAPAPDVSARMAAALGLGAGPSFIGDLAGSGAAGGGSAGLAGGSGVTAAGGASVSVALKWLAGLVAAAGLAAGGLTLVAESERALDGPSSKAPPAEDVPAEVTPPASEAAVIAGEANSAPGSAEPQLVNERRERPSTPRAAAGVRSAKSAVKVSVGDVAAEVKLLDAARGAVERGDRDAALAVLRRYDGRFPEGVLRKEAAQLRQAVRAASPGGPTRASREP